MFLQLPDIPVDAVFRIVGLDAEYVFYENGDRRKSCPAHEILSRHEARLYLFRSVILPECAGILPYFQHGIVMVVSYFVRHFIVAVFPQAVDDHIVGARPDSALPITSERIVFPVVGREGRHPVRAVELRRISEMRHHPVESFFRKDICLKCPESAHALGRAEASVIVLVI